MDKDIDFDFCIIPNPFASGGRNMIFITKSGENSLNREAADNKQYKDIKEILEKFGYTETSYLQFESSNNEGLPKSTILEMKEFLEDFGLSYSRELEVNIVRDLNSLKIETDKVAQNNLDFIYGDGTFDEDGSVVDEEIKNELIKSKKEMFEFKHKEPELKEEITLNFYLFLEFGFNQVGNPIIQFGGDFKDNDDYDDRNYIKIVESDFVRIHDPNSPNAIVLKSLKTQEDFLKETGILYSGFFKYQRRIEKGDSMILKETKYPYRLADVKKHLKPDQSIIVETNRMGYDRLIKLSDKIKIESTQEGRKFISTGDIEHEAEGLSKFLSDKMQVLSEKEEFEEASKLKRDVEFIQEKLDFIRNLDKGEITTDEYFDLFSIS
jgi:hypothetical protein